MLDRFRKLPSGSSRVAPFQMVQRHRGLNQSLVERPGRAIRDPPQVFPDFVGFVVLAGMKKNKALFEEVWMGHVRLTY